MLTCNRLDLQTLGSQPIMLNDKRKDCWCIYFWLKGDISCTTIENLSFMRYYTHEKEAIIPINHTTYWCGLPFHIVLFQDAFQSCYP